MSSFLTQLDTLEGLHGPQTPCWPVDPYEFLIWWHCGYPASDATCTRGWTSLQERVGVTPQQLLKAKPATLTMALKAGGLIPELRTERVRLIANTVVREFNGNLARAFLQMQPDEIRRALKSLPGIADPGADRIMLFGGICAIAAVPSNATQVALRMQVGPPSDSYTKDYLAGQELIEAEVSPVFAARQRAFLLLKIHGQSLCKRSTPKCDACPIAGTCVFHNSAKARKLKQPSRGIRAASASRKHSHRRG
jgi:endonuclease-3